MTDANIRQIEDPAAKPAAPEEEKEDWKSFAAFLLKLVVVVLLFRTLANFNEVAPVFFEFARNISVDQNDIAFGIMTTYLTLSLAEETVITHPVGNLMLQPGGAFGSIVICTRCANF